jgi:hypothetical protein
MEMGTDSRDEATVTIGVCGAVETVERGSDRDTISENRLSTGRRVTRPQYYLLHKYAVAQTNTATIELVPKSVAIE